MIKLSDKNYFADPKIIKTSSIINFQYSQLSLFSVSRFRQNHEQASSILEFLFSSHPN
ncbi:MAG: hypothetical protein RLZZ532_2798 [Cyanobacteriota bacterium]|jgi:hypothetical protein